MKRWIPIGLIWLLAVGVPVVGVVNEITTSGGFPTSAGWLVFVLASVR
jgi:Na+/glutamate symporter